MIDINIYMLAETKACPSCLFVQESAMCSSFQCAYWHLFCTGCWYCTAEAAKPHFSPSSFSLALFQIDTQFFALLTTPANWGQQFHSPNLCLLQPLSSLEMPSLHKAPCCAAPWSACVFRALLPWDRAGPAGSGRSLLGAGHCPVELHVLGHVGPVENHLAFRPLQRDLLGLTHSNSSVFFLVETASAQIHVWGSGIKCVVVLENRQKSEGRRKAQNLCLVQTTPVIPPPGAHTCKITQCPCG